MRKICVCLLIAGLTMVLTGNAAADPANIRPHVPSGGLGSLQTVFDDLYVSGPGINAEDDQIERAWFTSTGSGGAVATFVVELASFSGTTAFGLYSASDPSNKAEVFAGTDGAGDQALISFMFNGDIKVNDDVVASGFGSMFGFYIDVYQASSTEGGDGDPDTLDYTLYSDDALNPGGNAHALIYEGDDETHIQIDGYQPGEFTDDQVIVAFEDLRIDLGVADEDYTDLVVLVESVQAVPAPGAALLAMMGVGMVGWVKRRMS